MAVDEADSIPERASRLDVPASGAGLGSTMGSEMGKCGDESEEESMTAKFLMMHQEFQDLKLNWKYFG